MKQNRVIGLTGGSGSGKSVAAKIFKEFGAVIIDTDKISHEITNSDEKVLSEIKKVFSDKVFENGKLLRKALAGVVFSDKEALLKLNKILHPVITEKVKEIIDKTHGKVVVIDAPVLFEVKEIVDLCDETVAVCAPDEMRINRIMTRDGISRKQAENRIYSQMPQEKLAEMTDAVFTNDGDLEKLRSDIIGYLGK